MKETPQNLSLTFTGKITDIGPLVEREKMKYIDITVTVLKETYKKKTKLVPLRLRCWNDMTTWFDQLWFIDNYGLGKQFIIRADVDGYVWDDRVIVSLTCKDIKVDISDTDLFEEPERTEARSYSGLFGDGTPVPQASYIPRPTMMADPEQQAIDDDLPF